jgi:hypothetical protein
MYLVVNNIFYSLSKNIHQSLINIFFINFHGFFLNLYIFTEYFYFVLLNNRSYKNIFFKYIVYDFKFFFFKFNFFSFLRNVFFNEIFVDGLYYRVKYHKSYNYLGFILGYNHYILYKVPQDLFVFVHMKKRRILITSFNILKLREFSNELIKLKYPNLFKGKGLRIVFFKYRKKTPKEKKR